MSSTWASVVPAGTVPKDYPRHFDGLSARPARRFRADPHEVGRIEGIGPGFVDHDQELDQGAPPVSSTRASVGREPVTAEDCGSDCGSGVSNWARTPTEVRVPRASTERALVVHFPRRAGEGLRAPVAMVVSPRPERAGQADQDGRPSGAALPAIDLSVVRGVGSSTVVQSGLKTADSLERSPFLPRIIVVGYKWLFVDCSADAVASKLGNYPESPAFDGGLY